jgi:TonB family protein
VKRGAIGTAVCLALLVSAGCGRKSGSPADASSVQTRAVGEASWRETVNRLGSDACSTRGVERQVVLGEDADPVPREDSADCVQSQLLVQNLSPRPLQCNVSARLPARDDANQRWIESDTVLFPGRERLVAQSIGSRASSPPDLTANCELFPPQFTRQPVPRECKLTIEYVPNPDEFYPPEAVRGGEAGDVVLEFGVLRGSHRLSRVRVVRSSGHESLDNAALRMSQVVRADAPCETQRYNLKVRFTIRYESPAADERAVEKPR